MAVEIRALTQDDVTPLSQAFIAIGWDRPPTWFQRFVDQEGRERFSWIAVEDGEPAGYVTLLRKATYEPLAGTAIPEVSDLNVLPQFRRRQIASRLMDVAEAKASELAGEVALSVGLHAGYRAAMRLYVQRGYVPDGRGVTYRGRFVGEYETLPMDDDLLLHLTKPLHGPPDRVAGSRNVFEGKILSLRVDDVVSSDGHRGTREVVTTRGAVAVVCVHDGDIVLVRQYRHAIGRSLLEIPAGMVDDSESPETAAARELVEEVGLRPRSLEHLVRYYASPGFTDHRLDIYFADDCEVCDTDPDEGEVIEVVRQPFGDIEALLHHDEVRDAKTLIGLALVALRR